MSLEARPTTQPTGGPGIMARLGLQMDDGAPRFKKVLRLRRELRSGVNSGPRFSAVLQGPARRRWHRRRRVATHRHRDWALATLVLAAAVLLVAVLAGTGGSSTPRQATAVGSQGFFSRLESLAGSGAGSLAGRELNSEDAAINRVLAYTPYVRIAGTEHRELALTFDDGPGPYTPQILSILERRGVPATFFEVGVLERYFHASTAAIVSRGWVIGDHTETHPPMSRLPAGLQQAQLLQQAAAIGQYGAPFPRLFRPPYGMWNSETLALLHRYRMLMVLWTVDTNDYRRPGVNAIVRAAVSGARPGAIILLHDAGGDRTQTVQALPRIIAALRARQYRLVTLPKLLLDNPPPADQRISAVIGTGA